MRFAKQTRTKICIVCPGPRQRVMFTSYEGAIDYDEQMPGFHEPGWASWCAFRLLHPTRLCEFENEIRALFEQYKQCARTWFTYNEEKRALLQRYLSQPYDPKKAKRR